MKIGKGRRQLFKVLKYVSRPYVEKTLKKSNKLTSKAGSWTQRGEKKNK